MNKIAQIRKLSLWIFLIPFIAINLCLIISQNFELLNNTIFKAYDIRGVVGKELDNEIMYSIGIVFGLQALQKKIKTEIFIYSQLELIQNTGIN